jgi:hypothetical protein
MLDLIEMLFSWNGILTLIVVIYVIDDVCALGIKPRVREWVGRKGVLNKDPDVVLLEQEIVRLEQLIVDILKRGVPTGPMVTEVKSPFAERPEVKNPGMAGPLPTPPYAGVTQEGPHPLPDQNAGKSWTPWAERK